MVEEEHTESGVKWVTLTREQAQKHRLYGVKGWLIVIVIWLIFSVVTSGYQFFASYIGRARLIEMILSLVSLYTLAAKSPKFPLALGALAVIVSLVWVAFVGLEYELATSETGWFLLSLMMPIFGIAGLAYALLSKRVNITYRLRAKPAWLPPQT